MALIRPLRSTMKLLVKNGMSRVCRPCYCYRWVSLSSREVTPITIMEARAQLMDMVARSYEIGEEGVKVVMKENMLPVKNSQDECPVRHMKDSYQEVIIPLGQDPSVRERYISFLHGLRFGRLLEDLDYFSVWICYTHNRDSSKDCFKFKSPLSCVTALVDRIDLHEMASLSPFKDLKMCGHVTWVGRSSMEVTMTVEQEVNGRGKQQMLTARFVIVARNPETKKAAVVNPLQPEADEEWALFHLGERNRTLRQEMATMSLLKIPPNEKERQLIHDIFLETLDLSSGTFHVRVKPANSVWMKETMMKNMNICHPEQRNIYNKIFGGFLMRQAFELGWANAALYAKCRPSLRVVDDIIFRRPVEIGSLLYFSSQVVYTQGPLMVVKVHAEVVDIQTQVHETTNHFYFVFDSRRPDLPRVVPDSYAESMLYLDGMRHMYKAEFRKPTAPANS